MWLSVFDTLFDKYSRQIGGNPEGLEMEIFIENTVAEHDLYSLPVCNRDGGTTFVTLVLEELLWEHQTVVIDGTAYPMRCYRARIFEEYAQNHIGARHINVHARQSVATNVEGEQIPGWILSAQ